MEEILNDMQIENEQEKKGAGYCYYYYCPHS